ncbi:MAG: hypothetical protein IJF66_04020 [Clostridia bacterium]|nr:hypothetical protein [Clostridia bacterium]
MTTKQHVSDYPSLMSEWDWDKNNELGITPNKLSHKSNKSVWWICNKCKQEWIATPNNRSKTGCPVCAGKKVVKGINDLETLFPMIAKKWHPIKNALRPNEVTAFSNKMAWWICDKDPRHVFQSRINHVTKGEIVCPYCSNQKIIIGVNDFQTTNPELMVEWDWDKNNAKGLFPTKITKGVNEKAYWICSICGNQWEASVGSRAGDQHCGCPKCKRELSSSFPEKAIAFYLSNHFSVEENKQFDWLGNSEIDVYIPELMLGVEYDGGAWHHDIARDLIKDNLCAQNGIILIRVREITCLQYESSSLKIYRRHLTVTALNDCIRELISVINTRFSKNLKPNVNVDEDYLKILHKLSTYKKEKSVASSSLINSWNHKKNGSLNPNNISIGSNKKVWWICDKGHEWMATVSSRSGKQKCGCPYCAGKRVIPGENDLETLFPNIAKEWDHQKNTKKPCLVMPNDNKKYFWICATCGKSFQSSPSHRTSRNQGCPNCGRIKTTTSHFKKIINIDTNQSYNSIKEASTITGISAGSISNCCRGHSKTAGGFRWKYLYPPTHKS